MVWKFSLDISNCWSAWVENMRSYFSEQKTSRKGILVLERKEGYNFSVPHHRKYAQKKKSRFIRLFSSTLILHTLICTIFNCANIERYYCFKNKEKYYCFSPLSQEDGGVFKMLSERRKLACDKSDQIFISWVVLQIM